jgi:hypothetical protein
LGNGGFESGVVAPWKTLAATDGTSPGFRTYQNGTSPGYAQSGGWFGESNAHPHGSIYQDITVSVKADTQYQFSCWFRSPQNVSIQGDLALIGGPADANPEWPQIPFGANGQWAQVAQTASFTRDHAALRLQLYMESSGSNFDTDRCSVREVTG